LPSYLVILSSRHTGFKLAQATRRLKAQVIVIKKNIVIKGNKKTLKNKDKDIANVLLRALKKRRLSFIPLLLL
jgi:pyruvate/2-oxoglutarate dehydrogenase complex dihydrolipoamide dehydrogenase (E3) component